MAIKKWNDRLFIDGQMVTEFNIDSYVTKTKEQLSSLEDYRAVITNKQGQGIQKAMVRIETIGENEYLIAEDYCQKITKENVEQLYKEVNAIRTKLLTEGLMSMPEKGCDLEDYDNDYE